MIAQVLVNILISEKKILAENYIRRYSNHIFNYRDLIKPKISWSAAGDCEKN